MAPRALAVSLPKILRPALARRGRAFAAIVTGWDEIVGPALADGSMPERMSRPAEGQGGVLQVRVTGAAAIEFQHLAPQIIERINAYVGGPAVARLRLLQAPIPRAAAPAILRAPRPLGADESAAIDRAVAGTEDEALKQSLARFGRAIAGDSRAE